MKKCPFCFEEIQDAAVFCKYCNRDLAEGSGQQTPANQTHLQSFEQFMASYGRGWVLANKSATLLSYQKVIPAQKGSCLVAFLLLWLAIIPGILYMIYGNRPGKTCQLTVTLDANGSLVPSGDSDGMAVFYKYLRSVNIRQKAS